VKSAARSCSLTAQAAPGYRAAVPREPAGTGASFVREAAAGPVIAGAVPGPFFSHPLVVGPAVIGTVLLGGCVPGISVAGSFSGDCLDVDLPAGVVSDGGPLRQQGQRLGPQNVGCSRSGETPIR
jgi:hypothetical protein